MANKKPKTEQIAQYQFQPGQSGNPKGRPKGKKYFGDRFRAIANTKAPASFVKPFIKFLPPHLRDNATWADVIVARVIAELLKKADARLLSEILDRTDGKITVPIDVSPFSEVDVEKLNNLSVEELRNLAGYKKKSKNEK